MLSIQFSNRYEVLRDALLDGLAQPPPSPFDAQQIVVPSSAMRRDLTLAIADRFGICAQVEFVYLAEWLWRQIARVVRTVDVESPYAAPVLAWRIYELLGRPDVSAPFPRLANYLAQPDPVVRFDLSTAIAALFEQYITYRQDWMSAWLQGRDVALPEGSAQGADQPWQAALWRRISAELGADQEHPAQRFFRSLEAGAAAPGGTSARHSSEDLPQSVHLFVLPAIPPLYLAVLNGLARWVDVTLYVLNPCREYWFEIVAPKRLSRLAVRGTAAHHESGNRLLASWGRQTQAHIEQLLAQSGDAPLDDAGFRDEFAATALGQVQRSIFELTDLAPASLAAYAADRSLEVHVCHSLARELEVLQDRLLALFAAPSPPRPQDILIVMPDLEAAAPLIDAVFGTVPAERHLPYAITGRGRSAVNPAAQALLALLDILPSRFPASALVELLQQPLIGRRFGIGAAELEVIEDWIVVSGMRWGLDAEHRRGEQLPATERFTLADGLERLFLGYALPESVSAPSFGRIPAGNAEGSRAQSLGLFAAFVAHLAQLRTDLSAPRMPDAWLEALGGILDAGLAPAAGEIEDLAEVRESLRALHDDMRRGGLAALVPLAVVRASLESVLDDPARGGVPTGSITFSSMTSLRNLPFRVIGILGLNDAAFPGAGRPREFDLMAAAPRRGDRQRRLDDRNVFLDLLLAARGQLVLSYTGRSIRDNSVLPPSVVVAELIEALLPALAGAPGDAAALATARRQLIVEHPLQAFAAANFRVGADDRLRSFNRELCEALLHARAAPAAPADAPRVVALDEDADDAGDDAPAEDPGAPFFTFPLAPAGPEWRSVSLEQLTAFFGNPCRFLLRERLGMILHREDRLPSDDEPFLADYWAQQALAERLLPQALQGASSEDLIRLARAGIEYPPGTVGLVLLEAEMSSLQRYAAAVRDATRGAPLPPQLLTLPFDLEGESWQLAATLTDRWPTGLVRHRYGDLRPTDHLAGWLLHLVASASTQPTQTRWFSRDGGFALKPCADARLRLHALLALYRRGLREPLRFFPKSAWQYISSGRNFGKARREWHATRAEYHGEDEHAAYRLALRGVADPLDADFARNAEIVFGPVEEHLEELAPPGAPP